MLETKPTIKHEMTVRELKEMLLFLPDDTVVTVDLSMFLKVEEEPYGEQKA